MEKNYKFIKLRECSICESSIGYLYNEDEKKLFFDSSCGCSSYPSEPELRNLEKEYQKYPHIFEDIVNSLQTNNTNI